MEVVLLGTGCPSADPDRYGPATLIDGGPGRRVLVDCGSGVTQRLVSANCPGRDIDALFLTHLHSDHTIDLFQLIISSWHQGRDVPQRVYGPPGTKRYVDGLMKLWEPELKQRIAHELRPSTAALEVEVTEIEPGQSFDFAGMTVKVVPVEHQPIKHAYGFVFEDGESKIAISGDTTYCPALIEAAKDADILVHEVFIHHEMKVIEGLRSRETIENVAAYHTLSSVVGQVATEANVKALALTHIVPPKCDEKSLYDEVAETFKGKILIGHDLMRIDPQKLT